MINYVRKATFSDLDKIKIILLKARNFLKQQGLPQWQNGYEPNQLVIEQDIQKQEGYVFIVNGEVSGYAALVKGIDENYTKISEGQWDSKYNNYISIHRVAIDSSIRGKGISKQFLQDIVMTARNLEYHDIRIDTYPLNEIMERVIFHTGFVYKGMIHLPIPNGERKAYQLIID